MQFTGPYFLIELAMKLFDLLNITFLSETLQGWLNSFPEWEELWGTFVAYLQHGIPFFFSWLPGHW